MILEQIKRLAVPGTVIPKPEASADFVVKGWGKRRGEAALVYQIPNHRDPSRPCEKGVTERELTAAFDCLCTRGSLDRVWFNLNLAGCAKEGACNFTTIGGLFVLVGIACYGQRGSYRRIGLTP